MAPLSSGRWPPRPNYEARPAASGTAAALSSRPAPAGVLLGPVPAGSGGAIFTSGPLLVQGAQFLSNTATVTDTGGGGAIANWTGASLEVVNSHFAANTAWQDGGAIFNSVNAAAR